MSNADALDIVLRRSPAERTRRVFVTRGDSGKIFEHVKELVASGGFEPVVARERGLAGGPLLYDLVKQMCGCDTAIIHVPAGTAPADADGRPQIGDDVLIAIGAAMALYGRDFVLLVEKTIELPPCLQGLCECRYNGDALNVPATMRLLRAFKSVTQRPSEMFAASGARCAQQVDEAAAKH